PDVHHLDPSDMQVSSGRTPGARGRVYQVVYVVRVVPRHAGDAVPGMTSEVEVPARELASRRGTALAGGHGPHRSNQHQRPSRRVRVYESLRMTRVEEAVRASLRRR